MTTTVARTPRINFAPKIAKHCEIEMTAATATPMDEDVAQEDVVAPNIAPKEVLFSPELLGMYYSRLFPFSLLYVSSPKGTLSHLPPFYFYHFSVGYGMLVK